MTYDSLRARSSSWLLLSALALGSGCAAEDSTAIDERGLDETGLEQRPFGSLAFALSSTGGTDDARFVGNIAVLSASGDVVASVSASEDSPATQSVALQPGQYSVNVADGYSCTYLGSAEGFSGCTFVSANPNPFEIVSGESTFVALEVTLHFARGQDVTALFRNGAAEFSLNSHVEVDLRCGDGAACDAGQICASLDGSAAQCRTACVADADCNAPATCASVFATSEPNAPSGVCGG